MKEFNYELAKAGHPVQTRDGMPVRIICWDFKNDNHIVALCLHNNSECILTYYNNGRCYRDCESDYDLFMAPEKHEGWINIYKDRSTSGYFYDDAETAKRLGGEGIAATVKIEWED